MTLLHDSLRTTAANRPERTAVLCDNRATSFAELDRASDSLAAALQQSGVGRGDRVATLLENSIELVVSMFGVLKAGAAFTLIYPGTPAIKLRALLNDCQPRTLIAPRSLETACLEASNGLSTPPKLLHCGPGEEFEAILAKRGETLRDVRIASGDLAAIIYTSGSTGDHKGVMLPHKTLSSTTGVIADYLGNTADDVVACVLPLTFSYGLCQVLAGALTGYTLLLEQSFAFPLDVLKRMREHRATGMPAVPTIIARMLQVLPHDGVDLSSLRYMTNAAAPLPPAHIQRVRELLPQARFFSMYGQTECTRTCFLDPELIDQFPSSVGRGIAKSEVFVIDDSGRRAGPNVVGELVVRGTNVMQGYWNRPAQTAEKLRPCPDLPGGTALFTGDLFRTDDHGLLYFVARADDVFKCRGEKVSPREIENALCQMPEISEAAVFGVDDPIDGMAIKAVIVPREDMTILERDVRRHCHRNLEAALMPKHIEFRKSLPKTESGKVRKRDLRSNDMADTH